MKEKTAEEIFKEKIEEEIRLAELEYKKRTANTPTINKTIRSVEDTTTISRRKSKIYLDEVVKDADTILSENKKKKKVKIENNTIKDKDVEKEEIEIPKNSILKDKIIEVKNKLNTIAKKEKVFKKTINIKKDINSNIKPENNIKNTANKIKNVLTKNSGIVVNAFKEKEKDIVSSIKEAKSFDDGTKRPETPKKLKPFVIAVSVVLILFVVGTIGVGIFSFSLLKDKPKFDAEKLISSDSSTIYDNNGKEIVELGMYIRESVDYDTIPNSLVDAFLSIEDSRFFQHFGFDIPRFTKAALSNLRSGGFGQGGSTMTMQLVKNSYFQLDADGQSTLAASSGMAGVKRKMQEIVLAIECEKKLNKKEIISLYMNKINFGNNIRGVQKAAEYYFGKDVKDLNLVESCFLAGIINSPNNYNPYNELYKNNESYIYLNPNITYLENAQERTHEVLDLMVYHGYITEQEAKLAKTIKIEDILSGVNNKFSSYSEYFQDYIDAVIDEVEQQTGKSPYTTSMNIYTAMDPYMQQKIYEIETEQTDLKYTNDLEQSALVVLNNQNGELVALGGGRNQANDVRQFNRATSAYLQPGSSIKPILEYALAFDKLGWSTAHTITDRPYYLYGGNILVANAGGQGYSGDMLITEAIARSLNTPAVQTLDAVLKKIEEDGVKEYLQDIGFTVNLDSFDLQWAIGGNTCIITPVKLAAAHGMLMNEGYYVAPHTVKRIEFQNGNEYVSDSEGKQVISSAAAYMTATCEEYNVSGPYFNLMQILKRDYPVYAKTGTTDWGNSGRSVGIPYGAPKDMWMVAQTSNYTVTVWLGFDKAQKGAYFSVSEDMANLKGQICKYLLDELEEHFDYNPTAVARPDDVSDITIVKGAYPYCYPDDWHETVTGLIKTSALEETEFSTTEELLSNLPSKEETEGYGGTTINGYVTDYGAVAVEIHGGGYWCENGQQNISATNVFGKSTDATGACFFPHYQTTGSTGASGQVTLYVNDEYYSDKYCEGYTEFYDVNTEGTRLKACVEGGGCTTFYR